MHILQQSFNLLPAPAMRPSSSTLHRITGITPSTTLPRGKIVTPKNTLHTLLRTSSALPLPSSRHGEQHGTDMVKTTSSTHLLAHNFATMTTGVDTNVTTTTTTTTTPTTTATKKVQAVPPPPPPPKKDSSPTSNPPAKPAVVLPLHDDADLTPREIVAYLDRHVIGQSEAKVAVAVAMRNRWRRLRIADETFRKEVKPKNLLLAGPTGIGKTELARRIATLSGSPFVRVDATAFTEVGFKGRDVDTIVEDLLREALRLAKNKLRKSVEEEAKEKALQVIMHRLLQGSYWKKKAAAAAAAAGTTTTAPGTTAATDDAAELQRELLEQLRSGALDDVDVDGIEMPPGSHGAKNPMTFRNSSQQFIYQLIHLDDGSPGRNGSKSSRRLKKIKVSEAKKLLTDGYVDTLVDMETAESLAVELAQTQGIIFIDEIDKIASAHHGREGYEASQEGVQKDLLPIVEGTTVTCSQPFKATVNTDFILFIVSGAFHSAKPSDLLPEFQGRFPIRVELKSLNQADLYRILTETEGNLVKQHIALLSTEGLQLSFSEAALHEIAKVAYEANKTIQDIGARRLHTVIELCVQDISFDAPDLLQKNGKLIELGVERVQEKTQHLMGKSKEEQEISKFIL